MELLRWFIEGVVGLLRLYFGFWMDLGSLAREAMGLNMPPIAMDFLAVLIGVGLLAGGLARALQWDRRGNRPQAITLYTGQTPDQVVRNDRIAFMRVLLVAALIVIILVLLIARTTPPP